MLFLKPLLIVVPAGLLLGMVGGHLARPEMQRRAYDDAGQAMFQTRADRYGQPAAYPDQPDGDLAYVGGYSNPPDLGTANADWNSPHEDAWAYSKVPLPSVAELDARQAALLADPDVEFAVSPPRDKGELTEQSAEAPRPPGPPDTADMASPAPLEAGPEPRRADGEPAIW